MKNYLKLVHYELKRFSKLYIGLIALITVLQIAAVTYLTNEYMHNIKLGMRQGKSLTQIISDYGHFEFARIMSGNTFLATIIIGVALLGIYLFVIWYRDWFGKGAFVYRLLMLPTNRMNIYFSKATAILLSVFGLVALQVVLLNIENMMIQAIVPVDYRIDLNMAHLVETTPLSIVLPKTFAGFFTNYGIGVMVMLTLFTAVLFERSYRLRGIVFGIVYGVIAMFIFAIPALMDGKYIVLYHNELFWLTTASGLVVTIGSIVISRYLLKHKVTV